MGYRTIQHALTRLWVRRRPDRLARNLADIAAFSCTSDRDGYDVCWISVPNRSLDDAQLNAEFAAHAIQELSYKSSTKKVYVVGHSQGNLNIQVDP